MVAAFTGGQSNDPVRLDAEVLETLGRQRQQQERPLVGEPARQAPPPLVTPHVRGVGGLRADADVEQPLHVLLRRHALQRGAKHEGVSDPLVRVLLGGGQQGPLQAEVHEGHTPAGTRHAARYFPRQIGVGLVRAERDQRDDAGRCNQLGDGREELRPGEVPRRHGIVVAVSSVKIQNGRPSDRPVDSASSRVG